MIHSLLSPPTALATPPHPPPWPDYSSSSPYSLLTSTSPISHISQIHSNSLVLPYLLFQPTPLTLPTPLNLPSTSSASVQPFLPYLTPTFLRPYCSLSSLLQPLVISLLPPPDRSDASSVASAANTPTHLLTTGSQSLTLLLPLLLSSILNSLHCLLHLLLQHISPCLSFLPRL